MLAYNVHGLVHLPGEVKLHGCLDNISSFTFENLGASQNFPLQQIIRLSERIPDSFVLEVSDIMKRGHFDGPLPRSQSTDSTKNCILR